MKKVLWILTFLLFVSQVQAAMWVVLANGSVWKYPQAGYWESGGPADPKKWEQQRCLLYEDSTHLLVRALPKDGIKFIYYDKPKEAVKGYHVFWNTNGGFVHPAYEDYTVIYYHKVMFVVNNHSTFVPPDEVILRGLLKKDEVGQ